MRVDAISFRDHADAAPRVHARIEDDLGRMAALADETGQPVNFAPSLDEAARTMKSGNWGALDRRVTADVERAQRAMVRMRNLFSVA